jgi:microcompartment protein CcmL/EutN
MTRSLGLIETQGLVAAIVAADTMLKTANVTLAGKELADAGLVTIKVFGDTASVIAAVEAAAEIVPTVGILVSKHVILRPDDGLAVLFSEISEEKISAPEIAEEKVPVPEVVEVKISVPEPVENNIPAPGKEEKTLPAVREQKVKNSVKDIVKVEKPKLLLPKKDEVKEKESVKKVKKTRIHSVADEPQASLFDVENDTIARLREEALGRQAEKVEAPAPPEIITKEPVKSALKTQPEKDLTNQNFNELDVHSLRRLARSTNGFPIQGRQISKANRKQLIEYFKNLI